MTGIILPKNYYSLKTAKEITKICQPLIDRYEFKMIIYTRVFDDGSMYHLNNNLEYQEYFFKKEFMVSPPIPANIISKKFYYFITQDQYALYGNSSDHYKMGPPLCLFERGKNFFDIFMFCADVNNYNVFNLFLNDIDLFEKFKYYFKERAKQFINKSKMNKIVLPKHMRPMIIHGNHATSQENERQKKQLNTILSTLHSIEVFDKKTTFTTREIEFLKQFVRGCTVKEAAKKLSISPRTAEFHWNNIKSKLGLKKKSEIISLLWESKFFN